MSNAAARDAPSSACRSTAVDGQQAIGRRGAEDDQVELAGCTPARSIAIRDAAADIDRLRLVRPGDVPLADAGALDDPLVVRVDAHRRELVILEHAFGRTPRRCRRDTRSVASRLRSRGLRFAKQLADVLVHLRLRPRARPP